MILRYEDKNISGRSFGYQVDSVPLGFGDVVALAGDFYANWHYSTGDDTQISDLYVSHPEESITLFTQIAGNLTYNVGGNLRCVLLAMLLFESLKIVYGMIEGKDVAQVTSRP